MAEIRLPIVRDMHISQFVGGTITSYSSYMQNIMVDKYQSDTGERFIATQRPAIDMVENASTTVVDARGRGIYYWSDTNADYFVNNSTVYKSGYTSVVGTISSGTKKCSFHEVGGRLIIVDPENNEVWTITNLDVLAQVTDVDLPSTIAGGGATLDGYLFLIDDLGVIQHSDLDDATSWDALNFLEAERERDAGIYMARHKDHLVAMGQSTIEFFYNASNPTGAAISRRQDIFYNIGVPYEEAVWEDGDEVYFVGRTQRGDYGVYVLDNFNIKLISSPDFNTFITANYAQGSFFPLISGFAAMGHNFISLTMHTTPSDILPDITFVLDISSKIWGVWNTSMSELSGVDGFPVIGWTTSSASRFGTGILTTGDIITLKSTYEPIDTFAVRFYLENQDDYVITDYIANFGSSGGTNIPIICRIGHIDANSHKTKFGKTLEVVADPTIASQTLTIKWSNTDHITYTDTRTIDLSLHETLSRIGTYNRRTYQLEYSGNETIRLEALEYNVIGGGR